MRSRVRASSVRGSKLSRNMRISGMANRGIHQEKASLRRRSTEGCMVFYSVVRNRMDGKAGNIKTPQYRWNVCLFLRYLHSQIQTCVRRLTITDARLLRQDIFLTHQRARSAQTSADTSAVFRQSSDKCSASTRRDCSAAVVYVRSLVCDSHPKQYRSDSSRAASTAVQSRKNGHVLLNRTNSLV